MRDKKGLSIVSIKLLFSIFLTFIFLWLGCKRQVNSDRQDKIDIKEIRLHYTQCNQPVLIGQYLYAAVNQQSNYLNSIIRFHIFKRKQEVVYSSKHELPWFKVNKNWLVWTEGENVESIIVENLKNGKRKTVASGGFLYAPALDGDCLAWVENKKGGKSQVILYNLKTEQKKVVTTLNQACLYNNFLHLSKEKLVWTDTKGEPWHDLQNDIPGANGPWMGVGYYYLYDIKKDKIYSFRHTDRSYFYPGYAEYSQGKIFSINFQDHRDWNPQQFGYFSLADKKFYPLISPSNVGGFRVFGDYLAIDDDKGMQLWKFGEKKIKKINLEKIIKAKIDFFEFSPDGTLVLSKETQGKGTMLFVVKIKQ